VKVRRLAAVGAIVALAWVVPPGAATSGGRKPPAAPAKKLIEMGWDEPDTKFMRRHIAQLEASPFDGVVFHVNVRLNDGTIGASVWNCWGHRTFTGDEFHSAIEDLRATPFRKLKHNFMRFNVTPGDIDWFDDFSSVIANARLAARVARAGSCDGILFDTEPYAGPVFDYRRQRDVSRRSFDEYAAQVRRRGREVMEAFQSELPDLVVFYTFGYSHVWWQSRYGKDPLTAVQLGLLPAFLDGMLEGARGRSRFVDGHELGYSYRDPGNFPDALATMKTRVFAIVSDDSTYARRYSAGFGLWMDYQSDERGWDQTNQDRNWHTPKSFERSLRLAFDASDEYVWLYSQKPRWWTEGGGTKDLPAAYDQAVRRARPKR